MSSRDTMRVLALVASGALACAGCAAGSDEPADGQPATAEEALAQADPSTAPDAAAADPTHEDVGTAEQPFWGGRWGGGFGRWGGGFGWGGRWGGGWGWPGWGGGWGWGW